MPNRSPRISVLLPTYRYARFLPEAIDSILAQDYADFELVIGDDASDDGSADIIRQFAARDPRIRPQIHARNLGMVGNWNWCLQQARGEFIKFVFGDDCLPSPQALRRLLDLLAGEPRAVLAVSARLILDERSTRVDLWNDLGAPGYQDSRDVILRCLQHDRNLIGEPSAVLFRRAAGVRGFDPSFQQMVDQEMWFHLLLQGGLVYTPDPLCAFRRHAAQRSALNRQGSVTSVETMRIVARYFDFFASASQARLGSFGLRRRLFRRLYYARKEQPHTALASEAESVLMPKLGRGWYAAYWLLHRLTKPWENLIRPRSAGVSGRASRKSSQHPKHEANTSA
jgi:glycosyltransferase involved in cell wall biosynthesis